MTATSAPPVELDACPACDARTGRLVGVKHGIRILRCASCTLQYSAYAPADDEIAGLFDPHYFHGGESGYADYDRDEAVHRQRARGYLRDIARHRAPPGTLCDVGCATGYFLDEARRAGWSVLGTDVSAWAAARARARFGLDVRVGHFPPASLRDGRFDVVTFFNVFEQLPDPRGAEQALASMVRPGGLLCLETWDAGAAVVRLLGLRWHQYRPRETRIFLTRRAVGALFPASRWELLEYRARAKRISLRNGMHVLGIRLGPGALGDLSVPYQLGDLVWLVLRRRDDGR